MINWDGDIVGFTLFGPPPIGVAHLPASVGLSLIYGKNGSGKTRLLAALEQALSGVRPRGAQVLIHWYLPEVGEMLNAGWQGDLESAGSQNYQDSRGEELARLIRKRDQAFDGEGQEEVERLRISDLLRQLEDEEFSPSSLPEIAEARYRLEAESEQLNSVSDPDSVASRIAGSGRIVLEAIGSIDAPSWTFHSAIDLNDDGLRLEVVKDVEARSAFLELTRMVTDGDLTAEEGFERLMAESFPRPSTIIWGGEEAERGLGAIEEMVRDGADTWPLWAAIPLHGLGVVHSLPLKVIHHGSQDASRITRAFLGRASEGKIVSAVADDEVELSQQFDATVRVIEGLANGIMSQVMPQAPTLTFDVGNPNRWFGNVLPEWRADIGDGDTVGLEQLSAAEFSWAQVAIALAMAGAEDAPPRSIVLLDEPEQGLHGHLEAQLPTALVRLSRASNAVLIVATHSAALLNSAATDKFHLASQSPNLRRNALRRMDADLTRAFSDVSYGQKVGLTPAEILHLVRLFVIVEGLHDQLVLDGLLGHDLSAAGAVILRAGGAKNIPELTRAQLIWDYTDAQVLLVLDGLASETVLPLWKAAKDAMRSGEHRRAREALLALERQPGGEAGWLREFLERALTTGMWDRVHAHPLRMPDIVCYLPPDALGLDRSWDELIEEWRGSANPHRSAVDLKGWLSKRYGHIGVKRIEQALRIAVPTREIQDLGIEIQVLSGIRPTGD